MKTLTYKNSEGKVESLYEIYKEEPEKILNTNGYEYVDMGEAGIWAKYPLGVTEWNEETLNKILYFAWGETEGYTKSQVPSQKEFNPDSYKFSIGGSEENFNKYNNSDKLTELELEDDACHIIMGGDWRIPTSKDFKKLIDSCYNGFAINYNNIQGLDCITFTNNLDETKKLILPTAGFINQDGLSNIDESGIYLSRSLLVDNIDAEALTTALETAEVSNTCRFTGSCIIGILDSK